MNEATVVMDCEFFPSFEWFEEYRKHHQVLLEQYEFFKRASYRNRAYVAGPNGIICLSVPLEGGRNQRTLMKDLKVCNLENWQMKHWKTLESCYRRSAYFEYFEGDLFPFFKKKYVYLIDVNLESIDLLNRLLHLKSKHTLTSEFIIDYPLDFRTSFDPKEREAFIQTEYMQPFNDRNPFVKNLSMLDYLFCCGRI